MPLTVKSNIDMAGLPTTSGVIPLAHAVVQTDAPVVERMRAAGAIPIGRTNLPDMALRVRTDSSLHGLTRNPWNAGRTCAGSSGGEAVTLATGMSALGLGNDIGGSLRNPASACGIASSGLRSGACRCRLRARRGPPAGRAVDERAWPDGPTCGHVRAALRVLSGAHPRDPWSMSAPPVPTPQRRPVRVAVVAEPPGGGTSPAVAAAVRRCADALAGAGYDVVEASPPPCHPEALRRGPGAPRLYIDSSPQI